MRGLSVTVAATTQGAMVRRVEEAVRCGGDRHDVVRHLSELVTELAPWMLGQALLAVPTPRLGAVACVRRLALLEARGLVLGAVAS